MCRAMILVGTAGYSYKDWLGEFYPAGLPQKEMLSFYAREFAFTEVNSTYYRMPNSYMLYHMQAKTPEDFIFVVKAHGSMTHERDNNSNSFSLFVEALKPLVEAQKLGCILAQFPTSFRNTAGNREYLKVLRNRMGDLPLAVEFRHREWIDDHVFELMQDENLGFVAVDQPRFPSLVPPVVRVTSPIGYIRFHGRNYEKWWRHKEAYERYDYLYSEEELQEWVPRIGELAINTRKVFLSMNNHFRSQAVANAKMLRLMLQRQRIDAR